MVRFSFVFVAWIASGLTGSLNAEVLQKVDDNLEINWSTLKIRFYGHSLVQKEDGNSFRPAEKRAWQEGVRYFLESVPAVLATELQQDAPSLKHRVNEQVKTVSSVKTIYRGGSEKVVDVLLEADLPTVTGVPALAAEPTEGQTFVILKVTGQKIKPTTLTSISLTEGGDVPVKGMARWLLKLDSALHKAASTAKSVEIDAQWDGSKGVLSAKGVASEVANDVKSAIQSGRFVILTQKSSVLSRK